MVAFDYDLLALGYVKSLREPGGNITGIFFRQPELAMKRLQLLKEAFPEKHGGTVFWDQLSADQWQAVQSAAGNLGIQLVGVELREQPYDYERALSQALPDYRSLLMPMTSPIFFRDRERLADFALRHRISSMYSFRGWVEAGGLMSYGANIDEMLRRAAEYVERIAKGVKPSDLPVEQPTKFELVVNLRTAKAIGVTMPTSILLRADRSRNASRFMAASRWPDRLPFVRSSRYRCRIAHPQCDRDLTMSSR